MSRADFAGTMPVSDRQRFDEASLGRWLQVHLPGFAGLERIEQFRGGQSNPTFLLTAVDGSRYVLRKKPAGVLLPSAHAVDREFRVISALHGSLVPVARPLCLCTDASVIGTMFYLMEYALGRNFWDATLPAMTPTERAALYDEMNRVMVALHTLDYAAAGLGDYGKPGNYFARQIGRWSGQYRASETERIEAMEKLPSRRSGIHSRISPITSCCGACRRRTEVSGGSTCLPSAFRARPTTSPPTALAPGARRSSHENGSSAWLTTCSASPASARAS
jgi:hypothetical protein